MQNKVTEIKKTCKIEGYIDPYTWRSLEIFKARTWRDRTQKMNAYKTENAELQSELKEILKKRDEIIKIKMTNVTDFEWDRENLVAEHQTR